MANFIFNFNKPKQKREKQVKLSRYNIIESNCICVCNFTPTRGFFVINLEQTKIYSFTIESFKIKKGKKYSIQLLDNNKRFLCIVDNKEDDYVDFAYIPFMAGVICKGDIVEDKFDNNKLKFNLKDTTTNWSLDVAANIARNYVKNYENNFIEIEKWKNIILQKEIKIQ